MADVNVNLADIVIQLSNVQFEETVLRFSQFLTFKNPQYRFA